MGRLANDDIDITQIANPWRNLLTTAPQTTAPAARN